MIKLQCHVCVTLKAYYYHTIHEVNDCYWNPIIQYLHIVTFSLSSCSLFFSVFMAQSWDFNLATWIKYSFTLDNKCSVLCKDCSCCMDCCYMCSNDRSIVVSASTESSAVTNIFCGIIGKSLWQGSAHTGREWSAPTTTQLFFYHHSSSKWPTFTTTQRE